MRNGSLSSPQPWQSPAMRGRFLGTYARHPHVRSCARARSRYAYPTDRTALSAHSRRAMGQGESNEGMKSFSVFLAAIYASRH